MYTVYKHTNKINQKVYIGITKQAVDKRWQNGAGYNGSVFGNAINKYGWNNFEHEILFTGLTKLAACEMEQFLIILYRSNDRGFGYNVAPGGQTGENLVKKLGSENHRASSVKRIDITTGETKEYDTIKNAADDNGVNYRGISKCCMGIVKSYKGFLWEYSKKTVDKPEHNGIGKYNHEKQMKRVKMFEPGGAIMLFDSIKSAAKYVNVTPATVTRYLNGSRTDCTGREWHFAG